MSHLIRTLYSVTTWALAQADPSLPTPPAASNVFTFPQVADVLPAYNVMPVTRAGVPLPVVTPPLAVPGRPRSGGVLAATGLPYLISQMSPGEIWRAYIRYIGAGAVLAAGLITLGRTLPTIVSSAKEGLKGFGASGGATQLRTERDIPITVVLGGSTSIGSIAPNSTPSKSTLSVKQGASVSVFVARDLDFSDVDPAP